MRIRLSGLQTIEVNQKMKPGSVIEVSKDLPSELIFPSKVD